MEQASPSLEVRLHFLDYWRVIKSRWMFVLIIFMVVLLVVAGVTLVQTKEYQAVARIKVEQEGLTIALTQRAPMPSYDPYFLQTQYEIIQSRKVLLPVIQRFDLQTKLGDGSQPLPLELAMKVMKNKVGVRRYRDTSLIEIAVMDEEPQMAADLANAIAEVFEHDRLEVKRDETLKGINKLREELKAQLERLDKAQTEVERLRRELDVPVFGQTRLTDLTLQQLEQQLTQARIEAAARKSKVEELKKLSPLQLRNAIATIISDPNVQSLLQTLTESELRLEVLKQDYGPDHPNVRSEQASLEKLREQIDARLEGIMRGFDVDYLMAQSRTDEIQRQLNEAKKTSLAMEGEKYLPFRNAQREEESETRLYEALKQRLQQESVELELPRSPVEVIDRAEAPLIPVKPRLILNLILGAVTGLVLGVTLTFFIEFLDTSVKRIEEVEHYLDMPVLGVIPQQAGQMARGEGSESELEAYRMLRQNLEFARAKTGGNAFCFLSAAPGEGKSFTVTNLACVYAQHGARVLVVDCDLRRPSTHQAFGLANEPGLADYLAGGGSLEAVVKPTAVANLSLLSAGSANLVKSALPHLTSPRMQQLIRTVGGQYDMVLYDTPPVLGVSEGSMLANEVGTAVLVIQHRRYPRHMSRRAKDVIEQTGAKLIGVVINNVHLDQADMYFYYHHHYDDYLRSPGTAPAAPSKPKSDEIELTGKY